MIIDAHCHGGPGDGFTGPWDTDAPLGDYLPRAARAGIAHTLVWPAFNSDYAAANERLARLIVPNRARLTGVAFVHPERDRGRIADMVRRAVTAHGFRGIKCHRYDARITPEVCDAARRLRVPVVYDVMGEVESVALFAPRYPEVDFIIPHLGSFADDWKAQHHFVDVLARVPNVYTDTSGVRWFDLLAEAVRRAGPHKVLFGSDGPWLHPAVELAKVRALEVDARARGMIEAGNAVRLFRLSRAALQASAGAPFSSSVPSAPPAEARRPAARRI